MCQVQGCLEPDDDATKDWNVGRLCLKHIKEAFPKYNTQKWELTADLLKIYVLLQHNSALCLAQIEKLDGEMLKAKLKNELNEKDPRFSDSSGKKKPNYLKVSRALEYYEGYCWWPANRVLITGSLNSKDFFASGMYGHSKDPGAAPQHGEHSHRFQWHAISRLATNDFTTPIYRAAGWSHSPLQLFYELTQNADRYKNEHGSLWGLLMDSRNNSGWGNPDNVFTALASCKSPLVSAAMLRRVDKLGIQPAQPTDTTRFPTSREKEAIAVIEAFKSSNVTPADLRKWLKELQDDDPELYAKWFAAFVGLVYNWQKSGAPTIPPARIDHAAPFALYHFGTNNKLFESVAKKSYAKKGGTALLFQQDAPDKMKAIDIDIVLTSRVKFNNS